MTEQQISQSDLNSAWARTAHLPGGYETAGDVAKVQWAARRVVKALARLDLEINIAEARRRAGANARDAKRARNQAADLARLRGKQ